MPISLEAMTFRSSQALSGFFEDLVVPSTSVSASDPRFPFGPLGARVMLHLNLSSLAKAAFVPTFCRKIASLPETNRSCGVGEVASGSTVALCLFFMS